MEKAKKDVLKILVDSKNLDKQIQMKKSQIDKEIENELEKVSRKK